MRVRTRASTHIQIKTEDGRIHLVDFDTQHYLKK